MRPTALAVLLAPAFADGKGGLTGSTEYVKLDLKVKGEYSAVPPAGGDPVAIKFSFARKGSGGLQK